jgi:hypothetical protein
MRSRSLLSPVLKARYECVMDLVLLITVLKARYWGIMEIVKRFRSRFLTVLHIPYRLRRESE